MRKPGEAAAELAQREAIAVGRIGLAARVARPRRLEQAEALERLEQASRTEIVHRDLREALVVRGRERALERDLGAALRRHDPRRSQPVRAADEVAGAARHAGHRLERGSGRHHLHQRRGGVGLVGRQPARVGAGVGQDLAGRGVEHDRQPELHAPALEDVVDGVGELGVERVLDPELAAAVGGCERHELDDPLAARDLGLRRRALARDQARPGGAAGAGLRDRNPGEDRVGHPAGARGRDPHRSRLGPPLDRQRSRGKDRLDRIGVRGFGAGRLWKRAHRGDRAASRRARRRLAAFAAEQGVDGKRRHERDRRDREPTAQEHARPHPVRFSSHSTSPGVCVFSNRGSVRASLAPHSR